MIFCTECMKEVDYKCITRIDSIEVRGEVIDVEVQVPLCKECGEEIFVKKIEDINFKNLYKKYRIRKNLLQPEDIKNIREKYSLTQIQFAKILGVGEKTITRYENGSIQDEAINNLILLSKKTNNINMLWEENKNKFSEKERKEISAKLEPICKQVIEMKVDYFAQEKPFSASFQPVKPSLLIEMYPSVS